MKLTLVQLSDLMYALQHVQPRSIEQGERLLDLYQLMRTEAINLPVKQFIATHEAPDARPTNQA